MLLFPVRCPRARVPGTLLSGAQLQAPASGHEALGISFSLSVLFSLSGKKKDSLTFKTSLSSAR